jgi:hypothetical protein
MIKSNPVIIPKTKINNVVNVISDAELEKIFEHF